MFVCFEHRKVPHVACTVIMQDTLTHYKICVSFKFSKVVSFCLELLVFVVHKPSVLKLLKVCRCGCRQIASP